MTPKPVRDEQTGFIHHPAGFPFASRRVWFGERCPTQGRNTGTFGVIFVSEKYVRPGTTLEVDIPLRNETVQFRGKVVLVRQTDSHFEIGLWPLHHEDANRVRIVEQICHIESYLQEKKYRDGPYILNRDRTAAEWIAKYASSVPS